MSSKFKGLGLALAVVALVGAINAASASATPTFTAGSYPATLHGEQEVPSVFTFPGGREITCETGTIAGGLSGASSEIEVTPSYSNCHAIIFGNKLPVTITMNGCFFVETAAHKVVINQYTGDLHIACFEKPIEIHVYANATDHLNKKSLCTYTIGGQKNIGRINYVNLTAAKKLLIIPEITKLKYTRHGTLVNCGAASGEATFEGETLVTATNGESEEVGIEVSGE